MKMDYKVTIGIPAYNAAHFISRTLDCVLNQTFDDIQVLVVDDCSTDNTFDVLQSIQRIHPKGNHVQLIKHGVNQGVSAARNRIIKEAEGEYLYFMDSDDTIEPDTISLLYEKVVENNVDVAFASYRKVIGSNGNEITENYIYPNVVLSDNPSVGHFAFGKFGKMQFSVWNFLVRTSLLRKNNLSFININYGEDVIFAMQLLTIVEKVSFCQNITYSYLCRPNSLSQYQGRNQISRSEIDRNIFFIERIKEIAYKSKDKEYGSEINYTVLMFAFYTICGILRKKDIIYPKLSFHDIKKIIVTNISLKDISKMKRKKLFHMLLWFLGKTPTSFTLLIIWFIGKAKHCI